MLTSVVTLTFVLSVTAEDIPTETENTLWDPFKAIFVEPWNPNIGPYKRSASSADSQKIRAVFESKEDFEKYSSDCRNKPLTKVVKQVETEDDKKAILGLLENTDEEMDLAFLTADGLGLLPPLEEVLWPVAVTSFLSGVLNKTEYVEHINKTRANLSTLMAVGGKLRYEERAYQAAGADKPWKIYRAIIYEVKVGDEVRLIPICVQTIQVLVKERA